jgi:hypothetical protein
MASYKLNLFSGIRPRVPDALLPEGAAALAENCDFAYGELRNTRTGFELLAMQNDAASIYTEDGLSFYTWTSDVDAVRSPLSRDQFNRMYYTGDGGVKVANRLGTRTSGGPPSSSYVVGVPRPSVAPVLTVSQVSLSTADTDFTYRVHWEHGGVKYQETSATPSASSFGATITLTFGVPPQKATSTPEQAFPVYRVTAKNRQTQAQVFDVYTSNSSLVAKDVPYEATLNSSDSSNTVTIAPSQSEATKETRAYVYTYVNTYGEEGPPSNPSAINCSPSQLVGVKVQRDATALNYAPIKEIRVYRTPTGSTIAQYFYVGSIGALSGPGTFTFNDNVLGEQLNEPLTSLNFYPPDAGLQGLMSLPNGILAAWKDNELHFSEAYKPWAWPPEYVKTLPNAIVGGIIYGAGALITTRAQPYLVSGVSPDSMTASKINVDQAGVSKRSIAVVDGAVVYASNDGLVVITGGTASLAQSQRFFTRDVWRRRYSSGLSSMHFSSWDGRLVAFSSSNQFRPFMIRLDEADGTMTELPSFVAKCAFVSQLSDQMYYGFNSRIFQFNGGTEQQAVWQSREMEIPRPCNFGIAQAMVEGSWTVEFWSWGKTDSVGSDGGVWTKRHTETLTTGQRTFRLPSGYESDRYQIKVYGTGRFRELRVAQTARELASI